MKFNILKVLFLTYLIGFIVIFILFFSYVSIVKHTAKETYNGDMDLWLWNVGIFMAIMAGFYTFISDAIDLVFEKDVENKDTLNNKTKVFTNSKDLLEYLKSNKPKENEVVILNEAPTAMKPRRIHTFRKKS